MTPKTGWCGEGEGPRGLCLQGCHFLGSLARSVAGEERIPTFNASLTPEATTLRSIASDQGSLARGRDTGGMDRRRCFCRPMQVHGRAPRDSHIRTL